MKLNSKEIGLSSGGPLIAVVNVEDAMKLDLNALDRVSVKSDKGKIIVVVDISSKGISSGEIGLFDEVIKKLDIKDHEMVDIEVENKPDSIDYIKRKLRGEKLTEREIDEIISDIVDNKLSEVEISFFVAACYSNELSLDETASLIKAIVNNGKVLELNKEMIIDKHSSGGVPGNRTTMIIVPIIAAAGLCIPKTSSRAITSAAGTSDVMEVFANVSFSNEKIKQIVEKTNGCLVWCGAMDLASADDKIIKIERPLSLDPKGLLLASILAKKKAVGATHVLIDIPYGEGSKIPELSKVKKLRKLFIKLGKRLGMKVNVILTDGSQPIGNGIGPALEARDVLYVLTNDKKSPQDLKKKAVEMAGIMLKMVGAGDEKKALEILESGQAYTKFKEIVEEQEGNPNIKADNIKIGQYSYVIKAKKSGIIKRIDNKALVKIARIAGAPKNKEAGVYLNFHVGDKVNIGDVLLSVYSKNGKKLKYTVDVFDKVKIIDIE